LGKARPLGDDQAQHVLAAGAEDLGDEDLDDHLEHGTDRDVLQRRRGDRPDERMHHHAHELLEQGLLVAEVEVDRPLRDAGAAGNVVEPRGREAAGGELLERGRDDVVAPLAAPRPLLARSRCCGLLCPSASSRRNPICDLGHAASN